MSPNIGRSDFVFEERSASAVIDKTKKNVNEKRERTLYIFVCIFPRWKEVSSSWCFKYALYSFVFALMLLHKSASRVTIFACIINFFFCSYLFVLNVYDSSLNKLYRRYYCKSLRLVRLPQVFSEYVRCFQCILNH